MSPTDFPAGEELLEALSEGVLVLSSTGLIRWTNGALAPLLNRPPDQCRGVPLWEALRHRDIGALADEALRLRRESSREVIGGGPEERTYGVRARPLPEGGALLVFEDQTELRRLERLRRDFVANVSHELKTPLTALRASIETLLEGALEDPGHARDFLNTAQDEVLRLQRLIDDLLELARWDRPGPPPRSGTASFDTVARKTINVLRSLAERREVRLETQWPEGLPPVAVSADDLTRVLFNLLDNAVKFNRPQGQVLLSAARGKGTLDIRVSDTGPGIAPEDLPRVFERFFRSDRARSRQAGGTGLGLALVKHIVESHGGLVRAESRPGHGSVFTVTLPTAAAPAHQRLS